ncbi:MAG: DUF4293 domain-containing protein [Salibacteraceae bacterium]
MIQRIQTVYWVLTIVTSTIFFFLPISEITVNESIYQLKASGVYYLDAEGYVFDSPLITLSSVLFFHILLTLICIFQFKNRELQIKLSALNLFLLIGLIGLTFLYTGEVSEVAIDGSNQEVTYTWLNLILIIPIVGTFLAKKAVEKDEKLVKSLDRLR